MKFLTSPQKQKTTSPQVTTTLKHENWDKFAKRHRRQSTPLESILVGVFVEPFQCLLESSKLVHQDKPPTLNPGRK
jgi:hypothetical protein